MHLQTGVVKDIGAEAKGYVKAGGAVPFETGHMTMAAQQALNPAENLKGPLPRFACVVEIPQEEPANSRGRAGEDQAEHCNSIDARGKNVDVRFMEVAVLLTPERRRDSDREAGASPSRR